MKTIGYLILALFMTKGCNKENVKGIEGTVITYNATSRGFFRHVVLENGVVKIWKDRNKKETPHEITLSKKEVGVIVKAYNDVTLEDIPTYKAPSEKRFYDGAAIATFTVTHQNKTYESQPFDHMNPPAELEQLVRLIAIYTVDNE